MKSPAVKILALSIVLGSFLRLYKLNTNYVWFNDTFFRLTPALEILQGVPVKYDSSMIGVTGLGLICFSISKDLYPVVLAVCLAGILSIPLSYYFVLKMTNDERIAALAALFVSINPTLVALSKVLIWDIFVVFFFLVSGIIFLSLKEKPGTVKGVLLGISLFLLFSFKLPNVLFAIVFYLFLFYFRKFSIPKSKDIIASLAVYGALLGVFFYSFPNQLGHFVRGGGPNFFIKEDYLSLIVATLKQLISPIASPRTSMAFSFDMGIDIFFILGMISIIPLIFYFKDIKKVDELFSVSVVLVISLFYVNFSGWSHRYIAAPLVLMLFFVSYGIIKMREKSRIMPFVVVGVCIFASLGSSVIMVYDWTSDSSLAENHVATPLSLFDSVTEMAEIEGVDAIASSYGRAFKFYYLSGDLKSEIIDFYSLEEAEVEKEIRNAITNGSKVWYVEGWPDVFVFEGKNTRTYKKIIDDSFLLKNYYISREMIYLSDITYPSLTIYEVENK
ncbi:MAG: phospholipid carrier-dependent glycosyltransferase [Candidatus Methanofastidiosum sp.]|nr:phospholipid carrier-dependent glycosyltransferase [Methanofastidiosum sp.]